MPESVSVHIRAWAPFIVEPFSGLALISTLDPTVFIASAFIEFECAGSDLASGVSPARPISHITRSRDLFRPDERLPPPVTHLATSHEMARSRAVLGERIANSELSGSFQDVGAQDAWFSTCLCGVPSSNRGPLPDWCGVPVVAEWHRV